MPEPISAEELRAILLRAVLRLAEELGNPGAVPNSLPPLQRAILGALEAAPQTSKVIARKIGRKYNSCFGAALRGLVRSGHVRHTSDGYARQFGS